MKRALEITQSLAEFLLLPQKHTHVEVRIKVDGVELELAAEALHGPLQIPGCQERASEVRMDGGELGIHSCRPQHQPRLRRITLSKNLVDERLAFLRLIVPDQCRAEEIKERAVVLVGEWRKQVDRLFVFAHAQAAVREQHRGIPVVRLGGKDPRQENGGLVDLGGFVVRDSKIEENSRVSVIKLQGAFVFFNRSSVVPLAGIHGAEVGTSLYTLRMLFKELLVCSDCSVQVARLVELDGSGEGIITGLLRTCPSTRRDEQGEKEGGNQYRHLRPFYQKERAAGTRPPLCRQVRACDDCALEIELEGELHQPPPSPQAWTAEVLHRLFVGFSVDEVHRQAGITS